MVKIRLRRVGARNKPMYRIVVADSRSPRDGAFIEVIGHYNPLTDPETFAVDQERAQKWLKQGAQPTQTVARLLSKSGIGEDPKPKASKPWGVPSATRRSSLSCSSSDIISALSR